MAKIEPHHPKVKLEDHQDSYNSLDLHSMLVMDTFFNSLPMLNSSDFNAIFVEKRQHLHLHHDHELIALDNGTRECYKRRKIGEELREEVVTHLRDDGFAWRKYGQKNILHFDHPRHYYRCTHKNEQNCNATKQIQQISQNPSKFKLKYHGNHTCDNNFLKTSPYMVDSPKEQHSSAFVLSFDGSNPINPLLFPPSGSSNSYSPSVSNPVVDEEMSIGVGEDYYSSHHSTPTSFNNLEEDYSFILDDFPDILPDWWTS